MKTKIEIKSVLGSVLFELEKENNSLNDTIIEAVKSGADLSGADLRCADLRGADLSGTKNVPFIPTYLPDGEFIAWKKLPNGLIAKLKILEDSKRSRSTSDKCRCDKCLVLEFQNQDGSKSDLKTFTNKNYSECAYTVGEIVKADSWDKNRWNECSHGIHFFIDRQSAVDY